VQFVATAVAVCSIRGSVGLVELGGDDARDVFVGYVEGVDEHHESYDFVFGGETALCRGFGVGFVSHLALHHAYEVAAEHAPYRRDDAGNHISLGRGDGALKHSGDDVHDVVDSGYDKGRMALEGLVRI